MPPKRSIRSRWHVSVTLITGALIAPRAWTTWVNGPTWKKRVVLPHTKRAASNENTVDAEASPDWRRFRARLLEREAALTEATEGVFTAEQDWIHRSPLIEKGSVLLAKPGEWSVMFPCFHKAVILITDHDDEYSRGLVLNRPTPGTEAYGRLEFNVWYGGPCQRSGDTERPRLGAVTTQRQFCLHGETLPGSDLIAPGVYMTEPWAASRSIMEGKAHVDDFMLLDGHCMWGPGQLQAELDDGKTWEMVAMDSKAILRFLPRQQRAMRTRKLSRGLPLWRRLYHRVSGTFGSPSAPVERQGDQELLRFVHEELDVKHRTSRKSSIPPPGTPPHWQDMLRQALYHMQQESAAQQENACEALRNLIVDQDSRSFASSLGAIDLVLAAMKAHQDAPGVQGHCAGTLTHLAAGPLERQIIFAAQGLELVVSGMKQHESASLVQYKACAVLANLAADLESQLLVAKSGAIQRILRGMERHLNEQLVQDYCIGALFNLSRAPENMLKLALAGGEQVVKAALKIHPEAPTVRQVGQVLAATLEAAKR